MKDSSGRILTILLVAISLGAALWIFFNIPVAISLGAAVQKSNDKTTTGQLLNCTCECR